MEPDKPKVNLKRRKQVKSACGNCRKSKTACSDQRPCRRCIGLGIADSCRDVPRKRREKKKVEEFEGTDCFKYVVFTNDASSPQINTTSPTQHQMHSYYDQNQNVPHTSSSYNHSTLDEARQEVPTCSPSLYDMIVPNEIQGSPEYLNVEYRNSQHYSPPEAFPQQPVQVNQQLNFPNIRHTRVNTTQNVSPDPEKLALYKEIERLKQEKEQREREVRSLHGALQTQKLFSSMPLTRWKITEPGICYLQSFSEGFSRLIYHEPELLYACFTCVQMYTPREYPSTRKFLDLLGSGRVESLSVRVPILRGNGEIIPVVSMIAVEFENGAPAYASICMSRFDDKQERDVPYWEPTMVKLRSFANMFNNPHQQQPQPASPERKPQMSNNQFENIPDQMRRQQQFYPQPQNENHSDSHTFEREKNAVLLQFG